MPLHAGSEQVQHVVQAAGLAPSVHNTQPWRFVSLPDRLELHADPDRQLAVLDPDGRQLHLSCGAALLHARVAARALGLRVETRLLPDPSRPLLLAELVLTPGEPVEDEDLHLALAILRRHTHRTAFDRRPLSDELIQLLRADAEAEGALLHHVTAEDDLVELEVLVAAADAYELQDERYRSELAAWVHRDLRPDGVPVQAASLAAGSSLQQRDFSLGGAATDVTSPPSPDRPAVLVLASEGDDPYAWLQAGQALGRLLLRAADQGVQAQPLGQVTDVLAFRLGLRSALGMIALPQLVLRLGYAAGDAPTPRRVVQDVLTTVAQ